MSLKGRLGVIGEDPCLERQGYTVIRDILLKISATGPEYFVQVREVGDSLMSALLGAEPTFDIPDRCS